MQPCRISLGKRDPRVYIYICTHTYIYIHVCMYVCMYVCMHAPSETEGRPCMVSGPNATYSD